VATGSEKRNGAASPLAAGLIVVAALLAYGSTLWNGYTWDDGSVVQNNRFIRRWKDLRHLVSRNEYVPLFREASYRPVVTLSYFADGLLWRGRAVGGHAFNLALHVLNALLVWLLALRFVRRAWVAALAGVLFAVHPVLSEAINVVSFREDLLCAGFSVAAALCFVERRGGACKGLMRHVAGGLLLGLALLSKEMALGVPVVLVAYEALIGRRVTKRRWGESLVRLSPYLAVWAVFLVLMGISNVRMAKGARPILPGVKDAYLEHRFDMVWIGYGTSPKEAAERKKQLGPVLAALSTASAKLAMMPRVLTHHVWKIAVPARLNTEYGWPLEGADFATRPAVVTPGAEVLIRLGLLPRGPASDPLFLVSTRLARVQGVLPWIIGAAGALGYLVLTLSAWRRWPLAGFGLAAFLVLLAPVSGLAQISYIVSDRFVYLPMTVLVIVMAGGLAYGVRRPLTRWRLAGAVAVGLVVVCFTLLANARRPDWASNRALWQRTVTLNPTSAKAWVNLGKQYAMQKPPRLDVAGREYRRAVLLDPNLPPAYVNLSSYYMVEGQFERAIAVLRECNDRGIFSNQARYNLASCYLQLGDYTNALFHFERFPRPDYNVYRLWGETYYRMALLHARGTPRRTALLQQAEAKLRQALAQQPGPRDAARIMLFHMTQVFSARGDVGGALAWTVKAEQLDPRNCDIWSVQGTIYADAKQYGNAEAAYRRAVACNPQFAPFYVGLARAQAQQGKRAAARGNAQRALDLGVRGALKQQAIALVRGAN